VPCPRRTAPDREADTKAGRIEQVAYLRGMHKRRKIGRPLLVATTVVAVAAYACGTSNDTSDGGADVAASQTAGNLGAFEAGPPVDTGTDVVDAGSDVVVDAPKDAPTDGG
jgi:hypothetical protein